MEDSRNRNAHGLLRHHAHRRMEEPLGKTRCSSQRRQAPGHRKRTRMGRTQLPAPAAHRPAAAQPQSGPEPRLVSNNSEQNNITEKLS